MTSLCLEPLKDWDWVWCGVTDAEPGLALEFLGVTAVPRTTFVSARVRQGGELILLCEEEGR